MVLDGAGKAGDLKEELSHNKREGSMTQIASKSRRVSKRKRGDQSETTQVKGRRGKILSASSPVDDIGWRKEGMISAEF